MNKANFANVLFDENDKICVCLHERDPGKQVSRKDFANTPGQFFVINSVDGGRKGENATAFRNFFIEFDSMGLDEQLKYVQSIEMPYSTIVYSGKKSYHFIISLEEPLSSREQYDHFASYLHNVVKEADHSTRSCTKLSRYPGIRRNDTGKTQEIKEVKGRIKNADFIAWLGRYENCIPQQRSSSSTPISGRESIVEVLDWYVFEYLKKTYNERGVRTFVRCPICADEGCDTHEDNMCITHSTKYFNCFKNRDHNKLQLSRMITLRLDSGVDPALEDWKKHNEEKKTASAMSSSLESNTNEKSNVEIDEMQRLIKD